MIKVHKVIIVTKIESEKLLHTWLNPKTDELIRKLCCK